MAEDLLILGQIRLFGNRAAFGSLVEKYQSPLRRYLYYLTGGDGSLADDIAQDAFIKAFEQLEKYHARGSFRGWLFRIAYNRFIDLRRGEHPQSPIEYASGSYAAAQGCEILFETLSPLSEIEKNLIILSCIQDCSHSEIAKITELPLGTVKTNIARAKEKLKKHLKENERDF